jgi:flagellar capping protein FliD
VVGASGDTSNLLSAAGLTAASGATATTGTQSSISVQSANGATQTYYSNSNQITNAIPGVQINLTGTTSTPFSITVGQDTTQLVSAVNNFASAYNAAINEINSASAPPIVVPVGPGAALPGNATPPVGGGVLWANADVQSLKDRLTSMVSGFFGSDPNYNSLATVGLQLTSTFQTLTTSNNGSQNGGSSSSGSQQNSNPIQTTTYQGTDGQLQPLGTNKFLAAFQANPTAVQGLFQSASGLANAMGTYLTGITGFPTILANGSVGNIPTTSVIQGFENTNNDTIASLQDQIKQITDSANMQADMLRTEFTSTEGQLAEFQALQSQLSGFFKGQ